MPLRPSLFIPPVIQNKKEEEQTMSFVSVLKHIGSDILKAFQIGEKAAVAAQPFVNIAFPQIAGLFNTTLAAVSNAEALGAAAAANGSTAAQKAANVIVAINPSVTSTLIALGVPAEAITSDVAKRWTDAFVALLNTLPSPASAPVPAALPAK